MTVTAKIVCHGKIPVARNQVQLMFVPDYLDGRNQEWAKYTPALSLKMTVLPSIAERFEVGTGYTLTFDESD